MRSRSRSDATKWSSIKFVGFQNTSQLPAYYDLADVVAIPSRDEQVPLVLFEAVNSNCAIVASDECGSAVDLVRDGVNGYVFPAGHVDALAEILKKVLADRDELERMKNESPRLVDRFTPERVLVGLREAVAFLDREGRLKRDWD